MSSISNERSLCFQTDDFFNYKIQLPNIFDDRINVSMEHLPTQEQQNFETGNYLVTFSSKTEDHCVGIVDMVNSTKISARLGAEKMSRYYQIFLNSMSKIINKFEGKVLKNIGDSLLYYFPSLDDKNQEGWIKIVECSLAMSESHDFICRQLDKEKLPCLDYRISMDYGNVILMRSSSSASVDMIGTTINMCSKINRIASTNEIVTGGDMYERVKKIHRYRFKQVKGYSVGLKLDYPIYSVSRNNK